MKLLATTAVALAFAAAPLAASAAVELSYGYQANMMLPENGDTYFSGEGYVNADTAGFTFGIWAGAETTDSIDFEFSVAYGWEYASGISVATTATAYVNSDTGYDDTDLNVEVGVPINDMFALAFGTTYLIDGDSWDYYADGIATFGDFTVTAEVGDDGSTYWSLEGAYAFTDNVWASAEYADAEGADYEITLSVGYDF